MLFPLFSLLLFYKMEVYLTIAVACIWPMYALKRDEHIYLDLMLYQIKYIMFLISFTIAA